MLAEALAFGARAVYSLTTFGFDKGPHVTRYYMYRHLATYREQRNPKARVLSISHSQQLARLLGFLDEQIIDASYPDYDMLRLSFDDNQFDAVVSDQVLEHVAGSPQAALEESFRILRSGGIALHTSCFVNPIHGGPNDYWRFTPDALKLMVEGHGEIIDAGGWGNPYVWAFVALGLRFAPIPHFRWHPAHWIATKNSKSWPIVTWILARKKGAGRKSSTDSSDHERIFPH